MGRKRKTVMNHAARAQSALQRWQVVAVTGTVRTLVNWGLVRVSEDFYQANHTDLSVGSDALRQDPKIKQFILVSLLLRNQFVTFSIGTFKCSAICCRCSAELLFTVTPAKSPSMSTSKRIERCIETHVVANLSSADPTSKILAPR